MSKYTKPVKDIDAYLKLFPKPVASRLQVIRKLVHQLAPTATEVISYGMPAFKLNGIFLYFAAFSKHIGFYPYPSAIKTFQKDAASYVTGKGSIQFPHDQPLPIPLIRKIITYRLKEKLAKTVRTSKRKSTSGT